MGKAGRKAKKSTARAGAQAAGEPLAPAPTAPTAQKGVAPALLAWYRQHARDLPWRRTRDPYLIWLAEIMLQQTRVDTGIGYFERFRAKFPTVASLAAAPIDAVLKQWEGLGYYSRARNLHKAAQRIVGEFGGRLPESAAVLEGLPGVGRYTAAAVASIAFGERAAVLDGNVKRVLARLYRIETSIDETATTAQLWSLAQAQMPRQDCGDFNQAMMELGATVCTPTSPQCLMCPVRQLCRAAAAGVQADLPVRKEAKPVPHIEVVAGAVRDKAGRYLIGRRPEGKMLGGLWEFPGGKVKNGESRAAALARELHEELGVTVKVGAEMGFIDHAYTHFTMRLHLLAATIVKGKPQALQHSAIAWARVDEFGEYAFPTSDKKLMPLLPRNNPRPGGRRKQKMKMGIDGLLG